ncbi:MAG: prepilin-type N-terminal cleavage/methylation domain-containing protein [Candidatus Riflebacteria bacterium]|nr:prepilin-type N-terminal cleavage/methylation domain-containing protein [Candidatus Riflebacteria bacterium]
MNKFPRFGFSLVEIVVALFVMGLAVAPIMGLMSQTNIDSTASMYEVLAGNYATELGEQLLDLSLNRSQPRFKQIEADTHQSIKDLLEGLNESLSDTSVTNPRAVFLPTSKIGIMVSPLDPAFTKRKITVEPVTGLTYSVMYGECYRVLIQLAWRLQGESTALPAKHSHEAMILIRKD